MSDDRLTLEGLDLRVDARAKRLVPAGPRITAVSYWRTGRGTAAIRL